MSEKSKKPSAAERARAVATAKTENFVELVKESGLSPDKHFRFVDLSGTDFSGCDLRKFDFSGSRLASCKFDHIAECMGMFSCAELAVIHPVARDQAGRIRAARVSLHKSIKEKRSRVLQQLTEELSRHESRLAFKKKYSFAGLIDRVNMIVATKARFDATLGPEADELSNLMFELRTSTLKHESEKLLSKIEFEKWVSPKIFFPNTPPSDGGLRVGSVFFDDLIAPEMVVVPAGIATIGSAQDEEFRDSNEWPQVAVTIDAPFAVARQPVTYAEYELFCAAIDHEVPSRPAWATDEHPAVGITWEDAVAYCEFLSKRTGRSYRLPSEAEWEYAARAGTETPYWWGHEINKEQADFSPNGHRPDRWGREYDETRSVQYKTRVAETMPMNPWGLYGVHGNIWEWCADTWAPTLVGTPPDGKPRRDPNQELRVVRGGAVGYEARHLRSAARNSGHFRSLQDNRVGFRVVRDML